MKEGLNLRNEVRRGMAGALAAVTIGGLTPAMAEGLSENDKSTTPTVSTTENANGITTSEQGLANLLSDNNLEMASLASTESAIQMDVAAQIVNSRTLVPIKFVAENLGCKVDWNDAEKNQIVTVANKDTTIIMTKDKNSSVFSNEVTVNGVKKKIDVSGQIINGRTMVPLAFLSENLGLAVSYDKYTKGVGLIDAANSKALTLTINSKEVGIHSNLTAEEQLHYFQEYINAKNVVVDNLNYALKTMPGSSSTTFNPFELTASEINTYTKTGSDVGLTTFQVLPMIAEDGAKLPGIIMATGGNNGICTYGNEIKETIDWANSVDPTLMRSIAKTTKFICGNFCNFWSKHPTWGATYDTGKYFVQINESSDLLSESPAAATTGLFCLIYIESMALQYQRQNPSAKTVDAEHYKGNCLKNWANEKYSQGKITESMRGDLVGLAQSSIDY